MAVLRLGSAGPGVIHLQVRLQELGFAPGPSDGSFGSATETAVILFQGSKGLLPDGIVGPITLAALALPAAPVLTGAPAAAAFAGFDTSVYPGDSNMGVWKAASPYGFAAYYLKSPCHHSASWMGRRPGLIAMGWNLLPVYVGQQVAGVSPCTSTILTATQGIADANDAASKMASEGFAPGSYVFLDVERSDTFSAALENYISAWISNIAAVGLGPGIYCHKHNASDIRATMLAALPAPPLIRPRFWIVGGDPSLFDLATSKPTDVGVPFADVWQSPVSVSRTFGGVTINIDEDLSAAPFPAGS